MTPSRILKEFAEAKENAGIMAFLRDVERERPISWPSYCAMPLAVAITYVNGDIRRNIEAQLATCLHIWAKTRGVYRFHDEVYEEIRKTPLEKLPSDVLMRLPEWCVYIEMPGAELLREKVEGFWAWLDCDPRDNSPELRFLFLLPNKNVVTHFILLKFETIQETLDYLSERAKLANVEASEYLNSKEVFEFLTFAVSLVAYICADEADIVLSAEAAALKKKKNWSISTRPAIWEVGERIGAAIEKYKKERYASDGDGGTGLKMRPHTRRAHWHHYRVGEGRQQLICKWLPPIPVNWDKENENTMPVVIHKVKGGK